MFNVKKEMLEWAEGLRVEGGEIRELTIPQQIAELHEALMDKDLTKAQRHQVGMETKLGLLAHALGETKRAGYYRDNLNEILEAVTA